MHALATREYDEEAEASDVAEQTRWALQATVAQEAERALLRGWIQRPDLTVVDLGCGAGHLSRLLAEFVPDGRVIAVDADQLQVERTRRALDAEGIGNVRFVRAWSDALPMQPDYADVVYARFLLQNLPDPIATLEEARRVLRPGGRVVVIDSDDASLVVYPPVPGLDRLLAASREAQDFLGGDRFVGRKLRHHLLSAGFEQVAVTLVPITSLEIGFPAFADVALGHKRELLTDTALSGEVADAVLEAVRTLDCVPGAFASTAAWVGTGVRG